MNKELSDLKLRVMDKNKYEDSKVEIYRKYKLLIVKFPSIRMQIWKTRILFDVP